MCYSVTQFLQQKKLNLINGEPNFMFHGWNTWCPRSLDILSPCPPPTQYKIILRHDVDIESWKLLTLSVSVCVLQNKRKENLFTFRGLLFAVFDRRRCEVWHIFFLSMLFRWHWQFYMTSPLLQISCLQFTFSDYCLLSTSLLKAFAWPFNKLKGGWVGPKSASFNILFTLRN